MTEELTEPVVSWLAGWLSTLQEHKAYLRTELLDRCREREARQELERCLQAEAEVERLAQVRAFGCW